MERIIKATCGCCGTEFGHLNLGGGNQVVSNFLVPCICEYCTTITTANILNPPESCHECGAPLVLAGEISERKKPGQDYIFSCNVPNGFGSARTYLLEDKPYNCPACHEEGLRFEAAEIGVESN